MNMKPTSYHTLFARTEVGKLFYLQAARNIVTSLVSNIQQKPESIK